MWPIVLLCGFGMAIDPVRLGIAVVLLSRRRPIINLLAFWLGGMATAIGVGIAVLALLRDVALVAIRNANSIINDVRSEVTLLAGGRLQITVGVIMLLLALRMVARERGRTGRPVEVGGGSALALEERPLNPFARLGARTEQMLNRDVVWPAFVVGVGSSLPPYEGVVVLTVIMASGAAIGTQFIAFMVFTLMVLAVIEMPLVAYLAMPQTTEAVMLRFRNWAQTYRRQISLAILVGVGVIFVVQGVTRL
jgi:hypothetical protein